MLWEKVGYMIGMVTVGVTLSGKRKTKQRYRDIVPLKSIMTDKQNTYFFPCNCTFIDIIHAFNFMGGGSEPVLKKQKYG